MATQYSIVLREQPVHHRVTLLLNGKFDEGALPELERSISQAQSARQQIYIDLSEVTLVDRKAVQFFSERASAEIKLVNCPIYLKHWIAKVSDDAEG